MLGEIISPKQSKTKANDFLNLRLKMWTNYCVVAADNLLEGRTGVANEKRRLRSSRGLPTDLSQSNSILQNSIQTSINYASTTSEQQMWDEEGLLREHYLMSILNTAIHDNQLSTLWLNKSVMTKSGCVEEDFVMHEITNNKSILQKTTRVSQRLASRLASLALGS